MLEKDAEKFLKIEIEKRGGKCWKWVSPGRDGVPDRIVLLPGGRIYFVEMKTEVGKLALMQRYVIQRITQLGFDVRVLYGKTDVKAFLQEIDHAV